MSIVLTKKQEQGLRVAIERYRCGDRYTTISGYAGSGKSTLVKFIVQSLPGIDPETDVVYASYTGKATQVLLKKGNKNVMTLHKLLYDSRPLPNGKFLSVPKSHIDYKVVVVDEVSMCPKSMMELLFKHGVYIISLGDPFQLPPIYKDQDNGLLSTPHVFLDEVMRQALDSDIIRLSMKIREGEPIGAGEGQDAMVLQKKDLNTGMLMWADQIICGTNKTREAINNQMRELLGRGGDPEHGDKVICLRNYWEDMSDTNSPLVNGTIGYLEEPTETYFRPPAWLRSESIPVLLTDFISDSDDYYSNLRIDKNMLRTGEPSLDPTAAYKLRRSKKSHSIPYEFAYGYCITGHKAQGSEWDKVLVIEESFPFDRIEHSRWLYTTVTRASSRLVLIKK